MLCKGTRFCDFESFCFLIIILEEYVGNSVNYSNTKMYH